MSKTWADKHKNVYAVTDWIDKPSLFTEVVTAYLPKGGKMLDLGAGQGQDSRFFAQRGFEVLSTDLDQTAVAMSREKANPGVSISFQQLDLREKLPFKDEVFAVVYAHLSLHYFDQKTTESLFGEIHRVLLPGGSLALLVNSTEDPEYETGVEIEPDYFETDGKSKRYFSVESLRKYVNNYEIKMLDNEGETYKDQAKGIHNLIRFIGVK